MIASAAGITLLGIAALLQRTSSGPARPGSDPIVVAGTAKRSGQPVLAAASPTARPPVAPSSPVPSFASPSAEAAADRPPPLPAGLDGSFDPLAFARSVRAEKRDKDWAPAAEASLRSSIARISYMGPQMKTVSAYCGSTRCEVTGTMPQGLPMENLKVVMDQMQGQAMNDMLVNAQQQPHGAMFGGETFTIWTVREPVRAPR